MEAARGGSVLCHVRGRRAARGLGLRGHAGRHVSQGGQWARAEKAATMAFSFSRGAFHVLVL